MLRETTHFYIAPGWELPMFLKLLSTSQAYVISFKEASGRFSFYFREIYEKPEDEGNLQYDLYAPETLECPTKSDPAQVYFLQSRILFLPYRT